MLELSLQDLIRSPLKEVVLNNKYWPTAISDVADGIDESLSKDPELSTVGRAALLQLCFTWGGCNFYLPDHNKLKEFIDGYELYQLSLKHPSEFDIEISKKRLSITEFQQRVQEHRELNSSTSDNSISAPAWKVEVTSMLNQLDIYLSELALTDKRLSAVRTAVLTTMSFMKGTKTLHVPTCKGMEGELRKKLIYQKFNGTNARDLAREYHISLTHVYRLIKSETMLNRTPL